MVENIGAQQVKNLQITEKREDLKRMDDFKKKHWGKIKPTSANEWYNICKSRIKASHFPFLPNKWQRLAQIQIGAWRNSLSN